MEWAPDDRHDATFLFLGENSTRVNPIRELMHRTLLSWLPNAEGHTVEGATHLLPLQVQPA
jgi:hypothetical protein